MTKPSDLPISEADWQQTPPSVQEVVVTLWHRLDHLEATVAALQERLSQNSRNSSRPPSSDPPSVEKPSRRPSGRSPGGQPGHEGHGRELLPLEQVDVVVPVKPAWCRHCGAVLSGTDAHPIRHQVTELPPVQAEVREYQLHSLGCSHCGLLTEAAWPEGVPRGAFGPRLQAMVSLLSGAYRLSKRQIQALLQDGFGVGMGLGSVSQLEQATSQALAEPVEAARQQVQQEEAVNVDESGWKEGKVKAWLWTAVTQWVTVFAIRFTRGSKEVRHLLGEAYEGIVGSDRWSAYTFLPLDQRQICWAHLRREFQAFVERGGESARIGQALLDWTDQMFTWWHRIRDGTLKRSSFQTYMAPVKAQVHLYLWLGQHCAHPKTETTCQQVLKVEKALWTFVHTEGVEPTNNAAERALRHGVLWRKSSFGTHSAAGSRFVERILTVVATRRQQHKPVLEYLTAACQAALYGHAPPSLLPQKKRCASTS